MPSNYPPGVTGNEYAIAGPDYDREADDPCPECEGPMMAQGYREQHWVVCQGCDYMTDAEPPEPDPDRAYDEAVERRLFGGD